MFRYPYSVSSWRQVCENVENWVKCECGAHLCKSSIKRHKLTTKHFKNLYEKENSVH
jgi:hypothetical protein